MTYDFRASEVTEVEAYEALFEHAHHNKRLPENVIRYLKLSLADGFGASWVVGGRGLVYRGDVNKQSRVEQDLSGTLDSPEGTKKVVLHLSPGSSWSYDYEQAKYHATSGLLRPQVEILYTAATNRGLWLDLRELYKDSKFRGLRTEQEVICLESSVSCEAKWRLPG